MSQATKQLNLQHVRQLTDQAIAVVASASASVVAQLRNATLPSSTSINQYSAMDTVYDEVEVTLDDIEEPQLLEVQATAAYSLDSQADGEPVAVSQLSQTGQVQLQRQRRVANVASSYSDGSTAMPADSRSSATATLAGSPSTGGYPGVSSGGMSPFDTSSDDDTTGVAVDRVHLEHDGLTIEQLKERLGTVLETDPHAQQAHDREQQPADGDGTHDVVMAQQLLEQQAQQGQPCAHKQLADYCVTMAITCGWSSC